MLLEQQHCWPNIRMLLIVVLEGGLGLKSNINAIRLEKERPDRLACLGRKVRAHFSHQIGETPFDVRPDPRPFAPELLLSALVSVFVCKIAACSTSDGP